MTFFDPPLRARLMERHKQVGPISQYHDLVTIDRFDARDIPEGGVIRGDLPVSASPAEASASSSEQSWMQAPTLQEFKSGSERAYLVAKLRENGWNISKTAEVIDTPRSNLYKKLEQYQISQERDGN